MSKEPQVLSDQEKAPESSDKKSSQGIVSAIVKTARPKQWVKNVLVVVAPVAAGSDTLFNIRNLQYLGIAFVVFCLAASSIYFINDARDVELDRAHPKKKYRPIAAGTLPVTAAYIIGAVLIVASLGFSFLASHGLAIVIAVYIALQLAYCFGLKNQAVLDICILSSGFLLRAIAGGAATSIVLSKWFLLVMAFGSFFMAAGKRYSEKKLSLEDGKEIRKVLEEYTLTYLRFAWTISATVLILGYSEWAFEQGMAHSIGEVWYQISIIPFFIAVMRYAVDVDHGNGGAPEDIALSDHVLQLMAVLWAICIGVALYVVPHLS